MTQVLYDSSKFISQNTYFLYAISAIIFIIFKFLNGFFSRAVYAKCVYGIRKNIVTNGIADRSFKGFRVLRLLLRY